MFPLLPREAEILKPLWLIISGLCGRKAGMVSHWMLDLTSTKNESNTMIQRVLCTLEGDTECHVSGLGVSVGQFLHRSLRESETFSTFPIFKELQCLPLVPLAHVSGHFHEWVTDEFHVLPTGVREEAMGWTMTLKDDFGVITWTRRAGNSLSLFLVLSLFSFSAQSDIAFPKDHHFSWKAGKMIQFFSSL